MLLFKKCLVNFSCEAIWSQIFVGWKVSEYRFNLLSSVANSEANRLSIISPEKFFYQDPIENCNQRSVTLVSHFESLYTARGGEHFYKG